MTPSQYAAALDGSSDHCSGPCPDLLTATRPLFYPLLTAQESEMPTPLHQAVREDDLDTLRKLLEAKHDPNVRGYSENTPLFDAVYEDRRIELVSLLLEHQADPNLQTTSGQAWAEYHESPILVATKEMNPTVLKVLLQHGGAVTEENFEELIEETARHFDSDCLRLILNAANGCWKDINARDYHGHGLVHSATRFDDAELVQQLLEWKADPNLLSEMRQSTPMHIVRSPEVADILLEAQADISLTDERGWTPLMSAAEFGEFEMIKYLVGKGADCRSFANMPLASENSHLHLMYLAALAGASEFEADTANAIQEISRICDDIRNGEVKSTFQRWEEELDQFRLPLAEEHPSLLDRMEFLRTYLASSPEHRRLQRQRFIDAFVDAIAEASGLNPVLASLVQNALDGESPVRAF